MPPSGRRRARNKEPEQEPETAEITTPSRKRRRINGNNDSKPAAAASVRAMRRASAESDETIENQLEDPEAESSQLYDVAEEIIRHLRVAHYVVGVAVDHNNEVVEQSAQAFAKIAGRTWTYYVSNLSVIIGRPNVKSKSPGNVVGDVAHQDMQVDIDLGPDQQVSRLHAEICYDTDREQWFVVVNGRNGLVVDEQRLERGEKLYLRSGNVITVLGTQMMFMLPNEPPVVHPVIRKVLLADEEDEEADLADDKAMPFSGSFKPRGRPPAAQPQSSSQPARPPPQQNSTRAAQTLAALSSSQPMPGTPLQRSREQPQPKSKPSPAYARGLTLESTEEVDYSAESAKDIKPPHSYAQMIGQAIMSSEDENATLARIYEFIREKYAFFRFGGGGWQNSIRHNLSLSKHFEKIPRRTDEPGKGMKWQIVPEHRAEYMKKNFHDNRRAVRRIGSSSPRSPAPNTASTQTERLLGAMKTGPSISAERPSPRSTTPPLTGFSRQPFPAQTESFTPDRGPRPGNLHTSNFPNGNGIGPELAPSDSFTPIFDRGLEPPQSALAPRGPTSVGLDGTNETAVDSPTTFRNGTGAYDGAASSLLFTPMPQRMAPRQTMFSTIKAPSHYAKELFSSPAPFWKYVDLGSTPPRPQPNFGSSPEKRAGGEDDDDDDEDDDEDSGIATVVEQKDEDEQDEEGTSEPAGVQPSSPPPAHIGGEEPDESPSRTISRPGSRREGPPVRGLGPIPKFAPPAQPKFQVGHNSSINGPAFSLYSADVNNDDDDDEKGIDLAKGFQKIGSFHRSLNGSMQAPSASVAR